MGEAVAQITCSGCKQPWHPGKPESQHREDCPLLLVHATHGDKGENG